MKIHFRDWCLIVDDHYSIWANFLVSRHIKRLIQIKFQMVHMAVNNFCHCIPNHWTLYNFLENRTVFLVPQMQRMLWLLKVGINEICLRTKVRKRDSWRRVKNIGKSARSRSLRREIGSIVKYWVIEEKDLKVLFYQFRTMYHSC